MTAGYFSHFIFSIKRSLTIENNNADLVIQQGLGHGRVVKNNCTDAVNSFHSVWLYGPVWYAIWPWKNKIGLLPLGGGKTVFSWKWELCGFAEIAYRKSASWIFLFFKGGKLHSITNHLLSWCYKCPRACSWVIETSKSVVAWSFWTSTHPFEFSVMTQQRKNNCLQELIKIAFSRSAAS